MNEVIFCYAETPVHAGGSESLGAIDQPIQREGTNGLPTIWGSTFKGALKELARELKWPDIEVVFGSDPPGSQQEAPESLSGSGTQLVQGSLAVGDLRLVAFPVPTLDRTFAWATSPLLLSRLCRMASLAELPDLHDVPEVGQDHVIPVSSWGNQDAGYSLWVGDFDLIAEAPTGLIGDWARWLADLALPQSPPEGTDCFAYFRKKLSKDLLLVHDDVMKDLTREFAEVVARIQLKPDTKTVQHGPWYSEYLPTETIMAGLLRDCSPGGTLQMGSRLNGKLMPLGGDETVGKGLIWLRSGS